MQTREVSNYEDKFEQIQEQIVNLNIYLQKQLDDPLNSDVDIELFSNYLKNCFKLEKKL